MKQEPLILLCAGGTGGHVFPARALAEELLRRKYRVAFVTDQRGVKFLDDVPPELIHVVNLAPNGSSLMHKIKLKLSLFGAYRQARKLIKEMKPSAAVGFGGYPSAPPIYACQRMRVPTILHEQNATLGYAHRLLGNRAKVIALSHKNTQRFKNEWVKKAVLTGNPVRSEIIVLRNFPYPSIGGELNILIFGGSLGASSFANIIPLAIIQLAKELRKNLFQLKIFHQAREDDIARVEEVYRKAGLFVEVKSFFGDMPDRIENAHLLICRSGASTIAEVTCAGRPAVYIPYPWHKDKQQLYNAQTVADSGGGWIMEERNLTPDNMFDLLKDIIPVKLEIAAQKARDLGEPEAMFKLTDLVEKHSLAKSSKLALTHQS